MIIRKGQPAADQDIENRAAKLGAFELRRCSDAGGLTQFGAYVETLQPGSRSSDRHWHEEEDEFLYILSGEATVVEDDGKHLLRPGDAACWPAGTANAHQVVNDSSEPCSYLIFGTRVSRDTVHYPDLGRTLYFNAGSWRLLGSDGTVIREGRD
jgi:uncharacterized cupin superfamily protein